MTGMLGGRTRRGMLLTGGLIGLSACATLPGQHHGPSIYRLTRKSTFDPQLPKARWALAVAEPTAQTALDTDRIAFIKGSLQIDYYADSIWEARAPSMLQALIVQSFLASERITDVGTDRDQGRADMLLRTDLRAFNTREQESEPLAVRVALFAQLLRLPRRTIQGSQTFEQEVDIAGHGMDGVVAAFDQAAGSVLRRLVEWTLRTGSTVAVDNRAAPPALG